MDWSIFTTTSRLLTGEIRQLRPQRGAAALAFNTRLDPPNRAAAGFVVPMFLCPSDGGQVSITDAKGDAWAEHPGCLKQPGC
jgi:hypothetical protein